MNLQNFKTRIKAGLLFVLFAMAFYIVSSEDLLYSITLRDHPGLQNNKILLLHLIAIIGLLSSKVFIGVYLMKIYNKLKGKNIPFVGLIWVFSFFYLVMGGVFLMNLVSFYKVFLWIDGLLRASAGVVGIACAITLYKAYLHIGDIKPPEEYGRLADELQELKEENRKLQAILHKEQK